MAVFLLIVIYIAFIGLGLPDSLLGSAWPIMRHSLGVDISAAGTVSMVMSGGTIIASLFSDYAVLKFRAGIVTVVSVLLTAISMLGFSVAGSLWWLILMAIPLGLGAGAVDSVLNNYVALHYKPWHMSWLHCFWGVGALASPLVMARFIEHGDDWRGGYLTIGIALFAVAALLFAALPVWRRQDKDVATSNDEQLEAAGVERPFVLGIPGVPAALLTFLIYCGIEALVGLWGGSYLAEAKGISPATAARWVSFFFIGITAGRFITGFLTARLTAVSLIRIGEAGVLSGVILLLIPFGGASSALLGLLVMGIGCAPIFPCMIQETPSRFGALNSQKIIGLQMASAYTGSTFIPPLLGLAASAKPGIGILPPVLLVSAVLMILASELLNRSIRRKAA